MIRRYIRWRASRHCASATHHHRHLHLHHHRRANSVARARRRRVTSGETECTFEPTVRRPAGDASNGGGGGGTMARERLYDVEKIERKAQQRNMLKVTSQ